MKSTELTRFAEQEGWQIKRQAGSHRVYEKNGKMIIIPFHGSKEVPTGTAKKILKTIKGGN